MLVELVLEVAQSGDVAVASESAGVVGDGNVLKNEA